MKRKTLKEQYFAVPCTAEEKLRFQQLAESSNLALATYVRLLLYEKLKQQGGNGGTA